MLKRASSSVAARRLLQLAVDGGLVALAYYLAFALRFDSGVPHRYRDLLGGTILLVVLGKLLIFLFTFVWFRATLPRFRYDQLMDLGWKVLIPLSLGWMLLLATLNIARDRDWNTAAVVAGGFVAIVVSYLLLTAAMRTARARRELSDEEVFT